MADNSKNSTANRTIAQNRKAWHDYFVLDRFETGIELCGTEVKSIRGGKVNLKDSYCIIKDGQLIVCGMHISPYEFGNVFNRDPMRNRKLLMHKCEIMRLFGRTQQEGLALVPLALYWKGSCVKMDLALCKGKKVYDKRDSISEKETKRMLERAMKERNR